MSETQPSTEEKVNSTALENAEQVEPASRVHLETLEIGDHIAVVTEEHGVEIGRIVDRDTDPFSGRPDTHYYLDHPQVQAVQISRGFSQPEGFRGGIGVEDESWSRWDESGTFDHRVTVYLVDSPESYNPHSRGKDAEEQDNG